MKFWLYQNQHAHNTGLKKISAQSVWPLINLIMSTQENKKNDKDETSNVNPLKATHIDFVATSVRVAGLACPFSDVPLR